MQLHQIRKENYMKKYQKKAYLRIWSPVFIILTFVGILMLIETNDAVSAILFTVIITLIVGGFWIYFLSMFLLQMIGGRILDYQMSKQLSESDFNYYMERRKMSRQDIGFENVMGCPLNVKEQTNYIRGVLELYLKDHKMLHWYYKTFLSDCFIIK